MCSVISIIFSIISLVTGKNVHETNALMKKVYFDNLSTEDIKQ